jgi:hypothetical protein
MTVYTKITDALDSTADPREQPHDNPPYSAVVAMLDVSTRAHAFLESTPQAIINFTTSRIIGERTLYRKIKEYQLT